MKTLDSSKNCYKPSRLADTLKQETWHLHKAAETTGVIKTIIHKSVTLEEYILFISNLLPIYEALECSADWKKSFIGLEQFINPSVHRSEALRSDLRKLHALTGVEGPFPILKATRDYCSHINDAQLRSPETMLAHTYVRYLGDLNGGQLLQLLLRQSLGLADSCLSFYTFDEIENIRVFTKEFRTYLNNVSLSANALVTSIDAAKFAFHFNIALSQSVSAYKTDCN